MKRIFVFLICINFAFLPAYCTITDDFAEQTLSKNLKIKPPVQSYIADDFAEQNKNRNSVNFKNITYDEVLPTVKTNSPKGKLVVFDESGMMPVYVRIKKQFTTKNKLQEGDYIEFETTEDVTINEKFYPKGTTIKARIETISPNRFKGIPSDLIISNFSIDGVPLAGEINKIGANRSLWVYPLMCCGSVFFGTGLFFMFIRGGNAKIKPTEMYKLYAK